jgi:phosphohistidine phosphatase
MSKQLLVIRHAKSDWGGADVSDFDRPLNKRGERDAPEMADRLLQKNLIPEHIVSSPAKRALKTAKYFAEALNLSKKDIQEEPSIYEAPVANILKVVNNIDNEYNFVALFGHNPGLTDLVQRLSGGDIYDLPTCGMVLIEFPFDDWKLVSAGTGIQKMYDYPKNDE